MPWQEKKHDDESESNSGNFRQPTPGDWTLGTPAPARLHTELLSEILQKTCKGADGGEAAEFIAKSKDGILSVKGHQAFLTRGVRLKDEFWGRWIIGPYDDLTRLAKDWRENKALSEALFSAGVRIGRRKTDVAPEGDRTVTSFKSETKGQMPAVTQNVHPRKTGDDQKTPRLTDQYKRVLEYYQDQTLEAHHIVEKSIVRRLGADVAGGLEAREAPCVLVAAELHRRLFTAELAGQRGFFSRGANPAGLVLELTTIYHGLYRDELCELMDVAKVIINELGTDLLQP